MTLIPLKLNLLFISLLVCQTAHSTVYHCEKNGIAEFSQQPCGKDAKLITIKEQNPHLSSASENTAQSSADKDTAEVDRYIRLKQIDAQIAEYNNKIDTFKLKMDREIVALSEQSDAQLRNLVGAKKQAAIAKQMTAVSERYGVLIDSEQRSIDRLTAEKYTLTSSANTVANNEVASFIRSKQIMREISEHENKIDTYQSELNVQISELEQQLNSRPRNLADANSDSALADKMTALTSRFNTLIAIEQKQIDRLNSELTRL